MRRTKKRGLQRMPPHGPCAGISPRAAEASAFKSRPEGQPQCVRPVDRILQTCPGQPGDLGVVLVPSYCFSNKASNLSNNIINVDYSGLYHFCIDPAQMELLPFRSEEHTS